MMMVLLFGILMKSLLRDEWQRPKYVIRPSLSHWALPVFEPLKFTFPEPKLPERNLLFVSDLWSEKYLENHILEGYKPFVWVPDIS